MRPVTVVTLKILGGHPALDFTNTVHSRGAEYGPDVLQNYADLLDWGVRVDVLSADEASRLRGLPAARAEAALARAKELREALYRTIAAHPDGPPADLALLQREAAAAKRVLTPGAAGYSWQWPEDVDPDGITARIAWSAAELLTSPLFQRVHICPGANCGWLFADQSRTGRRLWCSEAGCGTRDRVRRWRSRQQRGA